MPKAKEPAVPVCMNPDCTDSTRPVKSRGVCACCYRKLRSQAIASVPDDVKKKAEKQAAIDKFYERLVRRKKIAKRSPRGKPRTAVA